MDNCEPATMAVLRPSQRQDAVEGDNGSKATATRAVDFNLCGPKATLINMHVSCQIMISVIVSG